MYEGNYRTLDKMGYREIDELIEILKIYSNGGLPEDFKNEDVVFEYNPYSPCVFLTNSDGQVCLEHNGKLEIQYLCPTCGFEGFANEMYHEGFDCCKEYLDELEVEVEK
jgi:hypothetical protein